MSEVEKLYENAMVEKITLFKPKHSITLGDYDEEYIDYPPFTAEKQLKLIKWLFDSVFLLCLGPLQNSENFENSLAKLVNSLWQDLTEEHKQQIREILE